MKMIEDGSVQRAAERYVRERAATRGVPLLKLSVDWVDLAHAFAAGARHQEERHARWCCEECGAKFSHQTEFRHVMGEFWAHQIGTGSEVCGPVLTLVGETPDLPVSET